MLLHLSEHEGFCVPLLEAFHFGVPVVARPAGAMPEVGGDAVLWADGDPAVAAELVAMALEDADLREELFMPRPRAARRVLSRAHRGEGARRGGGRNRMSEAYDPDNLLDRHTPRSTMELQYQHMFRREAELLGRRLAAGRGRRALGRVRLAPRPPRCSPRRRGG